MAKDFMFTGPKEVLLSNVARLVFEASSGDYCEWTLTRSTWNGQLLNSDAVPNLNH